MFENEILNGDLFAQGILTGGGETESPGTSNGDTGGRGGFDRGFGGPGSSYGVGRPKRAIETVQS
jgi:hypothetical protein